MEVAANTSGAATCKPALSRSGGHSDDFFLRIFLARPRAIEQRGADARRCCRGDCLGPFVDFLQARCTPLRHGNLHASVMGKDCKINGWNWRSVNPRASSWASNRQHSSMLWHQSLAASRSVYADASVRMHSPEATLAPSPSVTVATCTPLHRACAAWRELELEFYLHVGDGALIHGARLLRNTLIWRAADPAVQDWEGKRGRRGGLGNRGKN